MAAVGDKPEANGTKIAIAAAGPSPGKTPTRVPMIDPTKQKKSISGCNATENPSIKLVKVSIFFYDFNPSKGLVAKTFQVVY